MSEHRVVALDLGGTRMRGACLDVGLNILSRAETLTLADQGFERVMGHISDLVRQVMPMDRACVTGIGIAAPGPVNAAVGVLLSAGNLPGWENVPLADLLHDEFDVPVRLCNDANAAVIAETMRGAARGCRNVVYLTISTGIGSGVITDGRLLLGEQGIAADAGFMLMPVGDTPSTWQDNASGPAMARQVRERLGRGEVSVIRDLVQGDLARVDGRIIGRAARQGDALALEVVRRTGHLIGLGVANLLHLFNPQIVVIGGGVGNLGELLFEPIRTAVRTHCTRPYWENLRITASQLGDDAGVIGAAAIGLAGSSDPAEMIERLPHSIGQP